MRTHLPQRLMRAAGVVPLDPLSDRPLGQDEVLSTEGPSAHKSDANPLMRSSLGRPFHKATVDKLMKHT